MASLTPHAAATPCSCRAPCTRPATTTLHATTSNRQGTTSGGRGGTTSGRQGEERQEQQGGFQGLVTNLLFGAASSLDYRSDTTCVKCRGAGTCDCPACRGVGFKKEGSSSSNPFRKGLKSALGLQTQKGETSLVTNRCMRCHGFGRESCPACDGIGFRPVRSKIAPRR